METLLKNIALNTIKLNRIHNTLEIPFAVVNTMEKTGQTVLDFQQFLFVCNHIAQVEELVKPEVDDLRKFYNSLS